MAGSSDPAAGSSASSSRVTAVAVSASSCISAPTAVGSSPLTLAQTPSTTVAAGDPVPRWSSDAAAATADSVGVRLDCESVRMGEGVTGAGVGEEGATRRAKAAVICSASGPALSSNSATFCVGHRAQQNNENKNKTTKKATAVSKLVTYRRTHTRSTYRAVDVVGPREHPLMHQPQQLGRPVHAHRSHHSGQQQHRRRIQRMQSGQRMRLDDSRRKDALSHQDSEQFRVLWADGVDGQPGCLANTWRARYGQLEKIADEMNKIAKLYTDGN